MTPFKPSGGQTVSITSAVTSSNVQVGSGASGLVTVRIHNDASATLFIKHGNTNAVAATTSDIPVPSGALELMTFSCPCYIAAIAASGTPGVIRFTPGEGI